MARADSYQGLARTWRPQRFEDLVGQEEVAQSLQSALRQNRVVHGHLLAGPRGVGKTTSARILARALNCEQGPTPTPCGQCRHCIDIARGNDMDVIEIDAASNTGVDNIRDLRERVIQAPFAARYKVYIIDEVHMLSTAAFNALLKTLEEPPPFVIFIFATTELEKVPETVRSRCVVHAFRRLSAEDIARRLAQVSEGEGVKLEPAVAREVFGLIARSVEGGMRDALVILDQVLAMTEGQPTIEAAGRLLGLADQSALTNATDWLAGGDAKALLALIEDLVERGRSLERFVKSLVAYLRELMLIQAGADDQLLTSGGDTLAAARGQARAIEPAKLFNILNQLFELEEKLKQSTQARFLVEFTFLRLATIKPVIPIDEILENIRSIPEGSLGRASREQGGAAHRASTPEAAQPRSATVTPIQPAPSADPARVAVMQDSTGGTEVGEGRPPEYQDLIEDMTAQLPDASRFLGRYLRKAAQMQVEEHCVRLSWSEPTSLARRMVEKPENLAVIEQTFTRLLDRPMRVINQDVSGDVPPQRAEEQHRVASARPVTAVAAGPVLADGDPTPADEPVDAEATDSAKTTAFQPQPRRMPKNEHANRSRAAAPAGGVEAGDRRSALEKAQTFLSANPEAERRLKLLREMFGGQAIDGAGKPLSL